MDIHSAITEIKGVGSKTKELFGKMGVYTVGDILLHFPRNYIKYPAAEEFQKADLNEGEMMAVLAQVQRTPLVRNSGRMPVTLLELESAEKRLQFIWYRMPYIKNTLVPGKWYVFYGKITKKNRQYAMEQPEIYEPDKYKEKEQQLLPVYSLTSGISNNLMSKTIMTVLKSEILLQDYLPAKVKTDYNLCEYNYALQRIHFPDEMEQLIEARRRLVFDEFFLFIMGMQYQKEKQQKEKNNYPFRDDGFALKLMKQLPYELTGAQQKTIAQIHKDAVSPYAMQRLIQGDVGSGKTIVAFLMMAEASHSGYQSAIMAPTEVLAVQHYETYTKLCQQFGLDIPVILLTGSLKVKEKREAYARILEHPNAMIIGTHALIQDKAVYSNLGLVITDEQHRFGVKQRDTFSNKGSHPHILVMSATPIPRTLAIILYGDMDISVIDEVPAHRLPIKNCVVDTSYRPKAYEFILRQIKEGHQAYIICPLVEESENSEGENVTDYSKMLTTQFPSDVKIAMLHGKMKPEQKNQIMEAFSRNEIQILVSTTVIEVGVNVPNATVMMIENADRFGLAQLHQLRGRVGRGDAQSYCIMINGSRGKTAKKRLEILNRSNDGFYIASEDLKLRGPGDFFGIRQSGDLAFQLADIYQDAEVLEKASAAVGEILAKDPDLESEEHHVLQVRMQHFMDEQIKKMNL